MNNERRTRRPISARIQAVPDEPDASHALDEAEVREAFSRWASGVSVVAVRDEPAVYAITATAFLPVSIDPPRVLVSINPNATVLPFLGEGAEFSVSLLAESQRRLASIFADVGPLGRMHLPREGDPVVEGALASFTCRVVSRYPEADHTLVVGEVIRLTIGGDERPLVYFRREYGLPGKG